MAYQCIQLSFPGGMQDYNYNFAGCMEVTMELSCCKFNNKDQLQRLWMENKESLLTYMQQANRGEETKQNCN